MCVFVRKHAALGAVKAAIAKNWSSEVRAMGPERTLPARAWCASLHRPTDNPAGQPHSGAERTQLGGAKEVGHF